MPCFRNGCCPGRNPATGWTCRPAVSGRVGKITIRLNRIGAVPLPCISLNPMKFNEVAELVVADIAFIYCTPKMCTLFI